MSEPISYIARKYIEEGYDFVVAKVVSTKGSTPRHSGAVMLMREGGHTVGTVGGGLLEHETEERCRRMLETKEKHMTYEFILDEKQKGREGALEMGCGGDATIQIDYIEAANPGNFVEEFKVKSRAYIFGAGHVAKALDPVLRHVDFNTWIIDDREEYASRERFPEAEEVMVCSDFDHCFDDIKIDEYSYIIIVTRGHRGDLTVLRQALTKTCAYIGMIGSRRKNQLLYDELRSEGVSEEDIARVHAPIGLEIGSETPEEIGVSIAAEMIQVRAQLIPEDEKVDSKVLLHG